MAEYAAGSWIISPAWFHEHVLIGCLRDALHQLSITNGPTLLCVIHLFFDTGNFGHHANGVPTLKGPEHVTIDLVWAIFQI